MYQRAEEYLLGCISHLEICYETWGYRWLRAAKEMAREDQQVEMIDKRGFHTAAVQMAKVEVEDYVQLCLFITLVIGKIHV